MFLPDFRVLGGGIFIPSKAAWPLVWSIVQVALLIAAAIWFARNHRRFDASLSLIALTGSIVAFWSVTHVAGDLVEYSILWMSAMGLLSIAMVLTVCLAVVAQRTKGSSGESVGEILEALLFEKPAEFAAGGFEGPAFFFRVAAIG